MDDETRLDDEPDQMTMNERTVWAYLASVVITSGIYLTLMVTRLLSGHVGEISWVGPLLWTIGASVLGTVVLIVILTIGSTIAGTIARTIRHAITSERLGHPHQAPTPVVEIDTISDARDKEIDQIADHALVGVLGAGFVGALVLAMLDLDTFWIGNLLFVVGTVGAIVETITKIRLYRRGW